jgi:hypothetical protein
VSSTPFGGVVVATALPYREDPAAPAGPAVDRAVAALREQAL